jgi:UDP-2,3-diacylglucosamine hydrolase
LRSISHKGLEIHYLAGNHDFALSVFLEEEIGASIHLNECRFEYDGKRFFVLHGDGLAPADWGYRILKRVFRFPLDQKLFRWLHPDVGVGLAHLSSHTSRNYSRRRWNIDGWAYLNEAESFIAEGNDYVLFGHNHEPMLVPLASGIYVNTGDWMKMFSYATYSPGEGMILRFWRQPFIRRSEKDYT